MSRMVFCRSFGIPFRNRVLRTHQSALSVRRFAIRRIEKKGEAKVSPLTRSGTFRSFGWKKLMFVIFVGTGATIFFQQAFQMQVMKPTFVEPHGSALIGGSWSMIDHTGGRVDSEMYKGKYQLYYFGFTCCPDICPRELKKIGLALDILEAKGVIDELVPFFVSVDPRRDSPAQVCQYINQFHKRFIGLTGSVKQVAQLVKTMRAYFSPPPKGAGDDYIIDHVTMVYVMDREGKFLTHGESSLSAEMLADRILSVMPDVKPRNIISTIMSG